MDFKLLGTIEVSTDEGALALGGPRPRAILADLALNVGRTVPTTQLTSDIWGESPPRSATQTVETYVYRLRRALATADAQGAALVRRPTGYMLEAPPELVDVWRFRDLTARGAAALEQGDAGAASVLLSSALGLWRGPALADVRDAAFARIAAERREDERLTAVETRTNARLRLGQHRELVPELETLIAGAPYREAFHAQLMLALYRSGRQAEALAAFRRARQLLSKDLGIEPGRELRELERAVLLQAPELELERGNMPQRALHTDAGPAAPGAPAAEGPERPARNSVFRRRRWSWRWAVAAATVGLAAAVTLPILLAVAPSHASEAADGIGELTATGSVSVHSAALSSPPGAAVSADGSVWLTNPEKDVVYRIDPVNASILDTIPVGSDPSAITAANGDIWVANTLDGTVSRIDAAFNDVVGKINVGTEPTGLTAGDGSIWVADAAGSTLTAIDAVSGDLVSTIALSDPPFGVAFGAGSVWVSSPADDSVTRIDPRSRETEQRIAVGGSGPTAIVFGLGSVWVANGLDSTVSRLDPDTDTVASVVAVGDGPDALAIAGDSVWAGNRLSSTLTRINATRDTSAQTVGVGGSPVALTVYRHRLWVATGGGGDGGPRGGTLRAVSAFAPVSIDPALIYPVMTDQFSDNTYDTLVTFRKTGGDAGLQLVPDLALAMPTVSTTGTEYTFTLRPGLRYSNGQPVHPADFRYALERVLELNATAGAFLKGIVGAAACTPGKHCDLGLGVTADASADTVTFHLVAPDPDFLYKLTFEFMTPVPSSVPTRAVGRKPVPATGPYMITRYVPGKTVAFSRNPYFREWSAAAQPQGSPNRIIWSFDASVARETAEIEDGTADWTSDQLPDTAKLAARFPNRLHVSPLPTIIYAAFNTRVAPFNDPRVRRAFSLAANRGTLVSLLGGPDDAAPSCQILPPGIPGYRPYCPFTAALGPAGTWRGPDLPAAHKLVAASGTTGMQVTVWSDTAAPDATTSAFTVSVLRELGYRVRLHLVSHLALVQAANQSRRGIQAVGGGIWQADYPSASDFFDVFFRCSAFRLDDPADTRNGSFFCDPAVDRLMTEADDQQTTNPAQAAATWATVDRAITYAAPWVTLAILNNVDFLSARVANYEYNPFLGVLLDQLHVPR